MEFSANREKLLAAYTKVRANSAAICKPLAIDDYQLQSIVQASPPKWHLAHMSWFFEAFVLSHFNRDYTPFDSHYHFLFNSYYYTVGKMHPRARRGMLSRPTVEEIYRYRAYVDQEVMALINEAPSSQLDDLGFRVTLGLNHEEQHQELLYMDIKHNLSVNPMWPTYRDDLPNPKGTTRPICWIEREGGVQQIGHQGDSFAYDNETPRHKVLLRDHQLADRFTTNAEYLQFIEAGGYQNPALWLADGWTMIQQEELAKPLYWIEGEGGWQQYTLGGVRPLNPHEPVCHINYYEADAYARWVGKRLPTEAELESLLTEIPVEGNFESSGFLHPLPAGDRGQWFGELWAWTSSPYTPFPGFEPLTGSMGEYNGKFMANQMTLKGGSCATPIGHTRASYRNFFYLNERWAFTGLRLAADF